MGPVRLVVRLIVAQGVEQVRLVPDEGAVGCMLAAVLDPPLHDRVDAGSRIVTGPSTNVDLLSPSRKATGYRSDRRVSVPRGIMRKNRKLRAAVLLASSALIVAAAAVLASFAHAS